MVVIIAYSNKKIMLMQYSKYALRIIVLPVSIVMFAAKFMLHVVLTLGPVYYGLAVDSV